jgi:DNA-directed RNA polymerase specialized sigma24 family protein
MPDITEPRVPKDVLAAFLALDSTQDLILRVVMSRLSKKSPEFLIDDLVSDANFACVSSKSGATDETKLDAWVAGTAIHAIQGYFRTNARHARHFKEGADVDALVIETPAEPIDAETTTEPWMIGPWLDQRVAKSARDRETLELIVYKARTGKTDEQVCADRNLTIGQLRSRIHYFKKKHQPALARHKERVAERNRTMLLWLRWGGAIVAVAAGIALAWWLLWRPRPDIRPDRFDVPAKPVPSASASAAPPFDQALPPAPSATEIKPP